MALCVKFILELLHVYTLISHRHRQISTKISFRVTSCICPLSSGISLMAVAPRVDEIFGLKKYVNCLTFIMGLNGTSLDQDIYFWIDVEGLSSPLIHAVYDIIYIHVL